MIFANDEMLFPRAKPDIAPVLNESTGEMVTPPLSIRDVTEWTYMARNDVAGERPEHFTDPSFWANRCLHQMFGTINIIHVVECEGKWPAFAVRVDGTNDGLFDKSSMPKPSHLAVLRLAVEKLDDHVSAKDGTEAVFAW